MSLAHAQLQITDNNEDWLRIGKEVTNHVAWVRGSVEKLSKNVLLYKLTLLKL